MMAFCPEHPKWDPNPKFTPPSETTSIPTHFIWGVPPPGISPIAQTRRSDDYLDPRYPFISSWFLLMNWDLITMYNYDSLRAKVFIVNSSFNWILLLFFFCMLYFILLSSSNMFLIVLNILLHLTHIYANSLNFFYLLENDQRSIETSFFIRDFYCVKYRFKGKCSKRS